MTAEEIAIKLTDHEGKIENIDRRILVLEENNKTLNRIATSVEVLATNMKTMADEQKEQGERLRKLEKEPSEAFNYYKKLTIGCIITGVVGTIVGAILSLIIV